MMNNKIHTINCMMFGLLVLCHTACANQYEPEVNAQRAAKTTDKPVQSVHAGLVEDSKRTPYKLDDGRIVKVEMACEVSWNSGKHIPCGQDKDFASMQSAGQFFATAIRNGKQQSFFKKTYVEHYKKHDYVALPFDMPLPQSVANKNAHDVTEKGAAYLARHQFSFVPASREAFATLSQTTTAFDAEKPASFIGKYAVKDILKSYDAKVTGHQLFSLPISLSVSPAKQTESKQPLKPINISHLGQTWHTFYAIQGSAVYYQYNLIKGADAASFEPLDDDLTPDYTQSLPKNQRWSCDKNHLYYGYYAVKGVYPNDMKKVSKYKVKSGGEVYDAFWLDEQMARDETLKIRQAKDKP